MVSQCCPALILCDSVVQSEGSLYLLLPNNHSCSCVLPNVLGSLARVVVLYLVYSRVRHIASVMCGWMVSLSMIIAALVTSALGFEVPVAGQSGRILTMSSSFHSAIRDEHFKPVSRIWVRVNICLGIGGSSIAGHHFSPLTFSSLYRLNQSLVDHVT